MDPDVKQLIIALLSSSFGLMAILYIVIKGIVDRTGASQKLTIDQADAEIEKSNKVFDSLAAVTSAFSSITPILEHSINTTDITNKLEVERLALRKSEHETELKFRGEITKVVSDNTAQSIELIAAIKDYTSEIASERKKLEELANSQRSGLDEIKDKVSQVNQHIVTLESSVSDLDQRLTQKFTELKQSVTDLTAIMNKYVTQQPAPPAPAATMVDMSADPLVPMSPSTPEAQS